MSKLYIVDTCALISYFADVFIGSNVSISKKALKIIDEGFSSDRIKLIFPTAVFIELFDKWFKNAEDAEKIKSEVYLRIKSKDNMEIQPFDKEILGNFIQIIDIDKKFNFDNRDKQILAAAITMNCTLITSDARIIKYNEKQKRIPILS